MGPRRAPGADGAGGVCLEQLYLFERVSRDLQYRVVTIACNALMLSGGVAYRQAGVDPTERPGFDALPALGVGAREIAVIVCPRLIANPDYLRLAFRLLVSGEACAGRAARAVCGYPGRTPGMLNVRRRMSAPGRVRIPAMRGMTAAG